MPQLQEFACVAAVLTENASAAILPLECCIFEGHSADWATLQTQNVFSVIILQVWYSFPQIYLHFINFKQ